METLQPVASKENRIGAILVLSSAVTWSFGGVAVRFLTVSDNWSIIFWRSIWAAIFLFGFMLVRDGRNGMIELFKKMGLPGLAVALCFAVAPACFVIAMAHTTVANILLIQAGTPLIAALIMWIVFGIRVNGPTWMAIACVIIGIGVMVSDSFSNDTSLIGDILSLVLTFALAISMVITRRYSQVKMVPAACLGTLLSAVLAFFLATQFKVSPGDMGILIFFGCVTLGLGLALFVTGARMVTPAITALLGTIEPVIAPIWVWLFHNEIPTNYTFIGGSIVLVTLIAHTSWSALKAKAERERLSKK